MYKIETHMHTKFTSPCGRLDEKELVAGYLKAGYAGVVVTDHFNRDAFRMQKVDLLGNEDKVERFLEGYYRVKEEGERNGLRVYKGAELRFDGSISDYLLFGYHDELLNDPESIFTMGLEQFVPFYRRDGALLIQAHPYRKGCQIADHRFLDGVEVLNKHPGHDSHNELALAFAERWPELIRTSGSDCHEAHHIANGGILTEYLPEDDAGLVRLLRSRKFMLIG